MISRMLPVIICLAGQTQADDKTDCLAGQGEACEQILACIGDDGRWFRGEAIGRGPVNDVLGTLDNGIICSGQRMRFNKILSGSVKLTCEDGTQTTVEYEIPFLETDFDYGTGRAQTKNGRAVQLWVGQDLVTSLRRESGGIVSLLPCPGGAIALD